MCKVHSAVTNPNQSLVEMLGDPIPPNHTSSEATNVRPVTMPASAINPPDLKKPAARVLIVEDNSEVGALMVRALSRALVDATHVTSGESALRRLATEYYDLILLDIALPGINGLDVCRQLKANPRHMHVPVVFCSCLVGHGYKAEAQRLGAVDFIEKPFELLPFLTCVLGHLKLKVLDEQEMREQLARPLA